MTNCPRPHRDLWAATPREPTQANDQTPRKGHTVMRDVPSSVGRTPVRRFISLLGAIAAMTLLGACGGAQTPTGQPAPRSGQATPLAAPVGQTVLPFTDLKDPSGVAVDTDGNVYIADHGNSRVLKLAAGSSTPTVLPFPTGPDGLRDPSAVAVDKGGTLYVADCATARVWKLPAGSSTPTVLLDGLTGISGLAVDSAGNLYGSAIAPSRVWKLAEPTGSSHPTVLPFAGLKYPLGVAVDSAGNLYVVDDDGKIGDHPVVKLSADLTTQTVLPFAGLHYPVALAVDSTGIVYVTDGDIRTAPTFDRGNSRVVKLATGSATQSVLPFTDLNRPEYVAVRPIWMAGPTDSVYVSDWISNRVLKLGLG